MVCEAYRPAPPDPTAILAAPSYENATSLRLASPSAQWALRQERLCLGRIQRGCGSAGAFGGGRRGGRVGLGRGGAGAVLSRSRSIIGGSLPFSNCSSVHASGSSTGVRFQ